MKVTKCGRSDMTIRLLASVVLMMLLSKWCVYSSACPRSGNVVERINMARPVNFKKLQTVTTTEKVQLSTETELTLGPKDEVS